jgi:tRNA pseudouridine55 synthase
MNRFVGCHQQVPPMYSAVKVHGVPLYKAARAGRTVSRSPREFTVRSLEILSITPTPPTLIDVTFDVVCSKGTYVRTLCADIGEALGVGGHLGGLERRQVGRFGIEEAVSLNELAALAERHAVETRLYTLAEALADLAALHVDREAVEGLRHGVAVPLSRVVSAEGAWMAGAVVRLMSPDGRLVGIGKAPCSAEELTQAPSGSTITLEKVLT